MKDFKNHKIQIQNYSVFLSHNGSRETDLKTKYEGKWDGGHKRLINLLRKIFN